MNGMFYLSSSFNGNISGWNTANVTVMSSVFYGATAFNQDISSWDTSSVIFTNNMFNGATAFNCGQASGVAHDLMQRTATTGWQVGNVSAFDYMFQDAAAFNGDISNWCVSTIASDPGDFATGANVNWTVGRQPTWGACPYPNA
jgi:surface protein